jgi:hypothetical protein
MIGEAARPVKYFPAGLFSIFDLESFLGYP